jgi:ABC-type lipoprotein release transport system permease subunit
MGKPTMSYEIPIITVIILLVISVFSGYFPAKKAANLKPVECLRYE